ncbi:MCE family protein [Aeromicrobium sp. NPDC092404]|uniref:MCE family protein n=1 Tax=Aeromicrobium sp. NPDC092404 TaxID=3154976 RepID=UPI003427CC30
MTRVRHGLIALVLVILASAVVVRLTGWNDAGTRGVDAYFRSTTGLYVGDEVRVIGVKVGKVESITPTADAFRVRLQVPHDLELPAQVRAAIVPPNLVSGRFVELAPAYRGGARLGRGEPVRLDRTAVPVEWDEVKSQLTELSQALGPDGANKEGALGDAVVTADANLDGLARKLNDTLGTMATSSRALADGRGDLFATVDHLQQLVSTIRASDSDVRAFSAQLDGVAEVLAANRTDLSAAVTLLDQALRDVTGFVRTNKASLSKGVDQLTELGSTLAGRTDEIETILHVLPTALANFYNVMDPRYASVTGALSVDNARDLGQLVCGAVVSTGAPVTDCKKALGPLLELLRLNDLSLPGGNAGAEAAPPSEQPSPAPDAARPTTPAPLGGLLDLLVPDAEEGR